MGLRIRQVRSPLTGGHPTQSNFHCGTQLSPIDCQRQSVKCDSVAMCFGIFIQFVMLKVSFV